MVCYDVECGLVSLEAAKNQYGVVLKDTEKGYVVDEQKTQALRARLRNERGKLPMFDRGQYFNKISESEGIKWPDGWIDPDVDWDAETGVSEDEATAV